MKKAMTVVNVQRQSGAVLLVSLVMLLLLTIIGLSAVDITTLDTRITANSRDRSIAFDAAETALNVATETIAPGNSLPDSSTTGFQAAVMADNWWQSTDATWWGANSKDVTNYNGRSAKQNYVMEQPVVGSGLKVKDKGIGGPPKPETRFYRVTARGEGPGGASVHVQTIYARKVYNNAAQ
jgi:type IV pilus assembly protein PilX